MGRKPCCEKVGLKRGPWTIDEDHKLLNFILTNGILCWRMVPKLAGLLRCGKSCRLRWINYLRPDLKRGDLSETEENQIIKLHALLGNRWSKIASHFPGRTDNEIKNIWNTRIKKRLRELDSTQKPADIICPSPDQKENGLLSCSSSNANIFSSPPEEEQSAVNIIKKIDSTTTTETAYHHDHQQLPIVPMEESIDKIPSAATTTTTTTVEEKWVEPVDHDSFLAWDYFNLHPDPEEEFFLWDMPSHLSLNVP